MQTTRHPSETGLVLGVPVHRGIHFTSLIAALLWVVPQVEAQEGRQRMIVQVAPGHRGADVAAEHGLGARHQFARVLNGFAAEVPAGRLNALARDPRVIRIVPDRVVQAGVQANGKPVKPPPPPAGEVIPAGVKRVGADTVPQTGGGVGVAVLDTGIDFNHQDLSPSPVSFVSPAFGVPGYPNPATTAQDDVGHGTHVSGTIAAEKGNNLDVVGVAPGATLYAVKVLDGSGSGLDSDVIAGLEWVESVAASVNPMIRVVNMSLGRPAAADPAEDEPMRAAIQAVVAAGITVVVSAGNDSNVEVSSLVPSGFSEVIAVASTTAVNGASNNKRVKAILADTASFFTTDGAGVTISAPGEEKEDIAYPFINSVGILSTALGGGTTRMSGTSMAAPHVAGIVALMLQKNATLTPDEVRTALGLGASRKGIAPLASPSGSYSSDGVLEGVASAPATLIAVP